MFDKEDTISYLLKGLEEVDEDAIIDKVNEVYDEGRVLRIKFGMDPSSPDIHLGHAVSLRKIKQLQDLGHTAVIIIGDFTGAIGDPTGKSKTRNQLTKEEVEKNAQTYFEQIFKIIDKEKTEIHYNSEWYNNITFSEVLELCSNITVARMLERDDFKNRFESHKPIALHEFIYPLMQAYDSKVVAADIEMGGTDQTFNIMLGRNIQKYFNQSPQVALFVPLLVGIDGKEKMSKSLGNYIGVNENAKVMYEKVMKIPDNLIIDYYNLTTDEHPNKINQIKKLLANGEVNPRDIKMHLARSIIALYHSEEEIKEAERNFQAVYQNKNVDTANLPIIQLDDSMKDGDDNYSLIECIYKTGKYKSKSEIRRLIMQGAVKVNGKKVNELTFKTTEEVLIQVGKGNLFKASPIAKHISNIEIYPHMRSISDEKLIKTYQSIQPIATFGERKYTLKQYTLEELRSKEYEWNSENNKESIVDKENIETIGDFLCLHATKELAPLVDVLSQIPDSIKKEANAFEIIETPEVRDHLLTHSPGMHLSKVRVYRIKK